MKNLKFAIAACSLLFAFASVGVSAQEDLSRGGRPGWGDDRGGGRGGRHDDRGRGRRPNPGYYMTWQYAGQISAPLNGAPNAWHPGVDYCGTEYPQYCYNYGQRCYVNNGYWWDSRNNWNWFNYYQCR